jgi:hypothetical protein
MPTYLTLPIGFDDAWQVIATGDDGQAVTGYQPEDTLDASVYLGPGQAALFSPLVAWINAPSGSIRLEISAAQTLGLSRGLYRLEIGVTVDGKRVAVVDGLIELTSTKAVSSAPLRTPYCDVDDLVELSEGILTKQTGKGLGGFLKARIWASDKIDEIIVGHYRPDPFQFAATFSNPHVTPGIYSGWGGLSAVLGTSPWLKAQLAAGHLIVTPLVVDICAHLSLGRIFSAKLGPDPKTNNYAGLGAYHLNEGFQSLKTLGAEIDTNADGIADMTIDCGVMTIRY